MLTPSEIDQLADIVAEKVARKIADRPGSTMPETMIDVHEAAKLLNCSVPTIERWTRSGEIRSHKYGRLRRYKPSELLSDRNEKGGHDA